MSGNKRVSVSILVVMIMMLSISQITKGNNDFAFAPMSKKGLLPKPLSCATDAGKIPDCVEAVKHFKFKNVKKNVALYYSVLPKTVLEFCFLCVLRIVKCLRLHVN
ncbi:hypothetical protein AtEden1_Chr3g0199641 [Arabidopsis thaliana]